MDEPTVDGRRSVPISALEHYAYCPRQAALIHVDAYFESNVDTVRGDLAHAAVDRIGAGSDRHRQRVWRSLPVWSQRLGVHGVCDVVQFGPDGPLPVEHKSGAYRKGGRLICRWPRRSCACERCSTRRCRTVSSSLDGIAAAMKSPSGPN